MTQSEVRDTIAAAIIRQEGGDKPKSVCQALVRSYGTWNVGHLVWAGQRGAKPCGIGGRMWAGWPTREASVEGVKRDVAAKIRRGDTLRQLITAYAPPIENATALYVRNVESWTGLPLDTQLKGIM
jgi:hypothetical protein